MTAREMDLSPILQVVDPKRADHRFQDGALPHAAGVKSYQILRANRAMVDRCEYLIAYAPCETGNARRVLDYARRRGRIRIVEIEERGK